MNHSGSIGARTQGACNQKAQKGWLSRWTRKQWIRHWFVLKTGSLTYYRGPAAELCSFLDGVLDLSLIKHIEVQQSPAEIQLTSSHHHHLHHHHHQQQQQQQQTASNNGTSNSSGNSNQGPQFTFSLKMWNGECHLLGAASAAERSLWLDAINACINGDDDTATDSASSSDSSPTSNLSGKSIDIGRPSIARHYLKVREQQKLQEEQQLSHDLAMTVKSAIKRREQQLQSKQDHSSSPLLINFDANSSGNNSSSQKKQPLPPDVVVVERSQSKPVAAEFLTKTKTTTTTATRHSTSQQQHAQDIIMNNNNKTIAKGSSQQLQLQLNQQQQTSQMAANLNNCANEKQLQQEQSQALKRRLMCARNSFELGELKLVPRNQQQPQDLFRKRLCAGEQSIASRNSSDTSGDEEEDEEEDEDETGDEETEEDEEEEENDDGGDDDDDADQRDDNNDEVGVEEVGEKKQLASIVSNKVEEDAEPLKSVAPKASCQIMAEQAVKNFLKKSSLSCAAKCSKTTVNSLSSLHYPTTTMIADRQLPTSIRSVAAAEQQQQQLKQKKRVTFDLSRSSQHQLTSDSSSSSSDSSDDSSSLSPSSSVSSSEDEAELVAEPLKVAHTSGEQVTCVKVVSNLVTSVMPSPNGGALELMADELETSGELVRNFIARRKLRLLNKDGASSDDLLTTNEEDTANHHHLPMEISSGNGEVEVGIEAAPQILVQVKQEKLELDYCSRSAEDIKVTTLEQEIETHKVNGCDREPSESTEVIVAKLKEKLELAQTRIGLLEKKLTSSYANYGQLELSYKRLQGELSECEQLHRTNLAAVQARVDELSRELAASELKLAEARQKVLRHEEHLARSAGRPSSAQLRLAASQAKALNWLRTTQQLPPSFELHRQQQQQQQQQVIDNSGSQQQPSVPHHQPLLLMQHVKHTLAANNQQTLGLKLLNHSKQIQKKLNELELKVNKIHHQTATTTTPTATTIVQQQVAATNTASATSTLVN